jgi:hypothetical protein
VLLVLRYLDLQLDLMIVFQECHFVLVLLLEQLVLLVLHH